jgi:hypothetical protein
MDGTIRTIAFPPAYTLGSSTIRFIGPQNSSPAEFNKGLESTHFLEDNDAK